MKIQTLILVVCCTLFFVNCEDKDDTSKITCGDSIIVDTNYDTTTGDAFTLTDVTVTDNCLTATVGYGGGCGDELVSFELLGTTAAFFVTFPATLEAKIIMDDNDDCEAAVTKDISFDLTPLQDAGYNNIHIQVEGWDGTLEYSY